VLGLPLSFESEFDSIIQLSKLVINHNCIEKHMHKNELKFKVTMFKIGIKGATNVVGSKNVTTNCQD
jgi:hypothetical protein